MSKVKTKKIVAKRFKITKTGKVLHRHQGIRHLKANKSKSLKGRHGRMTQVTSTKYKNMIKRLMTS